MTPKGFLDTINKNRKQVFIDKMKIQVYNAIMCLKSFITISIILFCYNIENNFPG